MKRKSAADILSSISGFGADLLILLTGIAFNYFIYMSNIFTGVVLGAGAISICLLMRMPRHGSKLILKVAYFAFAIETVDTVILIGGGVFGWNRLLMLVPVASYFAGLAVRHSKYLRWNRVQPLVLPVLVTFVVGSWGDAPVTDDACSKVRGQDGIRLVVDLWRLPTEREKVRFVLPLDSPRPGLLLGYRKSLTVRHSLFEMRTLDLFAYDDVALHEWRGGHGEVIGLHREASNGDILVAVNETEINKGVGDAPVNLYVYSSGGAFKKKLTLDDARAGCYSAVFAPYKGKTVVITNRDQFYSYDPRGMELERLPVGNAAVMFYAAQTGRYIYGVYAHSPLYHVIGASAMKFDLETMKTVRKGGSSWLGYYDIKEIPGTGRYIASKTFTGGAHVFNSSLDIVRVVPVPRGVRNIAVDPSGRWLYAPNFFTGELDVVDLRENRVLPKKKWFIGKGVRAMLNDGKKILAANSCGVVEIDSDKIPGAR